MENLLYNDTKFSLPQIFRVHPFLGLDLATVLCCNMKLLSNLISDGLLIEFSWGPGGKLPDPKITLSLSFLSFYTVSYVAISSKVSIIENPKQFNSSVKGCSGFDPPF